MKMIYLLKLDNQAVDRKNTEEHSPCANVQKNLQVFPSDSRNGEGGREGECTRLLISMRVHDAQCMVCSAWSVVQY